MKLSKRNLMIFSVYMFFIMAYIEDTIKYGQFITFLALVLMVISSSRKRELSFTIVKSKFLLFLATFTVFCALSMLWAQNPSRSFIVVRRMIIILIEISIAYSCLYNKISTNEFLKVFMYGGYLIILYSTMRYGLSSIITALSESTRMTNEYINANTLGMCAAYSIVINIYFIIYEKLSIHDLFMIPSLVIIAVSGSRKSILIVILGFLMIIIMKNIHNKKFIYGILRTAIGIVVVICLVMFLSRLPIFALLNDRMSGIWSVINGTAQKGTAGYIRMIYNQIGWDVFKNHPFLGIGIYNSNRYVSQYAGHVHFHNNFIELLACGGIVGFFAHYIMYIDLFGEFWKARNHRTKEYDICVILLLIRFLMGYGHIQYNQISNYIYLLAFSLLIVDINKQRSISDNSLYGGNN